MTDLKTKIRSLIYRALTPVGNYFHFSLDFRVYAPAVKALIARLHPVEPIKPLIRIGPDGDGGYLLPDDLEGIVACFSPGVDIESRFEVQLADRGMELFLADYSVEKPRFDHPRFHFTKKYIGAMDHGIFMSMDTWVNKSLPNDAHSDLLLQMDIEGFEYETIFSMSQALLNRFRIIVIEFHSFERIFDKQFYKQMNRVFDKLLVNHSVVHIHPNNYEKTIVVKGIDIPPYLEFTLVRNDRVHAGKYVKKRRHPLDQDNVPLKKIELSPIWYLE